MQINEFEVLENGTHYVFNEEEFSQIKHMIYCCDECHTNHVKEEFVDEFLKHPVVAKTN